MVHQWNVVPFRPDLIEFHKLTRSNATHNLQLAFNVAEHHLGLTKLLDPEGGTIKFYYKQWYLYIHFLTQFKGKPVLTSLWFPDVNTENPDEKSIITYVVSYYHYFSKMKALIVEGKRVGKVKIHMKREWMATNMQNISIHQKWCFSIWKYCIIICCPPSDQVLDNCIEAEKIINRYEALASDLLDWIEKTIAVISNQKFANSLTGVQQQLQAFTTYCTIEKPIK